MQDDHSLPDAPPPLHEHLDINEEQLEQSGQILTRLADVLELPIVLSQDGAIVLHAGTDNDEVIDRLARLSGRVWREGATRLARELIRFEEETIGDEDAPERINLMLYSAHITGAATLSVGWDLSTSLTQIRAEIADIKDTLTAALRY